MNKKGINRFICSILDFYNIHTGIITKIFRVYLFITFYLFYLKLKQNLKSPRYLEQGLHKFDGRGFALISGIYFFFALLNEISSNETPQTVSACLLLCFISLRWVTLTFPLDFRKMFTVRKVVW